MSKKYKDNVHKNSLIATIMANAKKSAHSVPYLSDNDHENDSDHSPDLSFLDEPFTKTKKHKHKHRKASKSLKIKRTKSNEFNHSSYHKRKPNPPKTRKKNRSYHFRPITTTTSFTDSDIPDTRHSHTHSKTKRKPQLNRRHSHERHRSKSKEKLKLPTPNHSQYGSGASSLQSIHSDDEEDVFDDLISPKSPLQPMLGNKHKTKPKTHRHKNRKRSHSYDNTNEYKSQTKFTLSIDENIETFSMNLDSVLALSPFVHIRVGFDDYLPKKHRTKREVSFNVNTYSNSLHMTVSNQMIFEEYTREFGSPQTPKHLITYAKHRGVLLSFSAAIKLLNTNKKTIPNSPVIHARKPSQKLQNINSVLSNLTMSDSENESDNVSNAEEYRIQSNDSDIDSAEEYNAERDKKRQMNRVLSQVLSDSDTESPNVSIQTPNGSNHLNLKMSQTLIAVTPEPSQSELTSPETEGKNNVINEDTEMIYECVRQSQRAVAVTPNTERYNHKLGLDLVAMLDGLDESRATHKGEEHRIQSKAKAMMSDDFINKKLAKRRKKKKKRSQSQPEELICDAMSDYASKSNPNLSVARRNNNAWPKGAVSVSPRMSNGHTKVKNSHKKAKKGKQKTHKRSHSSSTDQKKSKTNALKLEEWKPMSQNAPLSLKEKRAAKNGRSQSLATVRNKKQSKTKCHKMDFNLFNISVKANRRYRLMDGRIGISKFKGKTAFGKGTETYVGILLEYGEGEHDGTVYEQTYFRCKMGKGIFVHPFQLIEDLGRFNGTPMTQEIIDSGQELVSEAKLKINKYLKKHKIKKNKKMY